MLLYFRILREFRSAAMQNFFVKSREYMKSRVPNFCRNFISIGNMTRLIIAFCLLGLNKLPIFSCPSVRTLIKNKFICDVTSLLSIPCPRISSIHILLNNSIFIKTSEFKRCSLKSMNNLLDFFFKTPPFAYKIKYTTKNKDSYRDDTLLRRIEQF